MKAVGLYKDLPIDQPESLRRAQAVLGGIE